MQLGDRFPTFELMASGVQDEVVKNFCQIRYTHSYGVSLLNRMLSTENKPFVIYFWPADFTFVCPTEIIGFEKVRPEIESRGYLLLGCSVDSHHVHAAWRDSDRRLRKTDHWWLSDQKHELVRTLGIESPEGTARRATYIVTREIEYMSIYPDNVGRNPDEIVRIIDAIGTKELCGCNRKVGGPVLIGS